MTKLLEKNFPSKEIMIKTILNGYSLLWDKNDNGIIEMMKDLGVNNKNEMLKKIETNLKKLEISKIQYKYI